MKPFRIPIRVVFYREDGTLYAHSLEFGLLGDGPDHHAALENLMGAIEEQIHATTKYGNPADLFTPAEPEIFERFAAGSDVFQGELEIDERWRKIDNVTIQSVDGRDYIPEPIPA